MNKINHASVDPCRREKWDLLFACLELSRLKYPEECENGMHFPFYINLCERSQFIFGHAGVISHSLYCNSFYPTSEKKVKSWVNSLKSDMFKMQNTCYSLFKFCLISQQQWGNSGKHLFFPPWSGRGKHLSAVFSSEVLYMQQAVCLQWRWRQDANQSDCFTSGPLQTFIQVFWHWLGSEWKMCYCQKSSELMDSPNTEEQKYTQRKEEELLVQHGFNCCVCVCVLFYFLFFAF